MGQFYLVTLIFDNLQNISLGLFVLIHDHLREVLIYISIYIKFGNIFDFRPADSFFSSSSWCSNIFLV